MGRWRDLLWGGASDIALPALEALCGDGPARPDRFGVIWPRINWPVINRPWISWPVINRPWARLQATLVLAGWWAFHGQPDRALQLLEALAAPGSANSANSAASGISGASGAIARQPERVIPLAVLLQRQGRVGDARQVMARALQATPALRRDPQATLVLANLAADDASRLALINRLYTDHGFAPLARRDPQVPLSLETLALETLGGPPDPAPAHGAEPGKVSVILPVWQAQDCIATALRSLCAQTHADLEIIVVDDASTDRTGAIVAAMAVADPRITLLRQAQNGGAYAARNAGLARATGAFITTHDADDWSHPQKIATQVGFLARHPGRMAVMTHWARCTPPLLFTTNWRLSPRLLDWSHSSLMMRRAVPDRLGGWDDVRVSADTEMIWRIEAAYGAGSVARIHPQVPLAFARDAPGSLTRQPQTHARSIYHGLRHYYREISRYWHARHPQGLPAAAQVLRRAMLPAAMFGAVDPAGLLGASAPPGLSGADTGPGLSGADTGPGLSGASAPPGLAMVLYGDLGDPAVIARARRQIGQTSGLGPELGPELRPELRPELGPELGPEVRPEVRPVQTPDHRQGQHWGIAHVPDPARYRPTPSHAARFCDDFFALLQEGRVQIVLPDQVPAATQIDLTRPDLTRPGVTRPGVTLIDLNSPETPR